MVLVGLMPLAFWKAQTAALGSAAVAAVDRLPGMVAQLLQAGLKDS